MFEVLGGRESERKRKIAPSPAGENSQTYVWMIYICEMFASIIQISVLTFLTYLLTHLLISSESARSVFSRLRSRGRYQAEISQCQSLC